MTSSLGFYYFPGPALTLVLFHHSTNLKFIFGEAETGGESAASQRDSIFDPLQLRCLI